MCLYRTTRQAPRSGRGCRGAAAAWVVALVGATGGPACSALFVEAPPPAHKQMMYFDCTSSRVLPVADLAVAALYGVAMYAALADSSSPDKEAAVLGGGGMVVGFGWSGLRGWRHTSECREAKAELVARMWNHPAPRGGDPWLMGGPAPVKQQTSPASPGSPSGADTSSTTDRAAADLPPDPWLPRGGTTAAPTVAPSVAPRIAPSPSAPSRPPSDQPPPAAGEPLLPLPFKGQP